VYKGGDPAWLGAVGKLKVSSQKYQQGHRRHYTEDCSATLVSPKAERDADILVSAWHCFEYYRDLSRSIEFSLPQAAGQTITRRAQLMTSGGDMQADWAILRLDSPIPYELAKALLPHPQPSTPHHAISIAGFSRDGGLGQNGAVLTYHDNCTITRHSNHLRYSDCLAFKGASGGSVVTQFSGKHYLAGVISAGNGGDTSVLTPLSGFDSTLRRYLRP